METEEGVEKKRRHLEDILEEMAGVVVAFSGGVDSTLLAKVASDVLKERVLAVTAVSATYPKEEEVAAKNLAAFLGVRHRLVKTAEWNNPHFRQNKPNRCYYCKKELFHILTELAYQEGLRWVVDGETVSDAADFRPGRRAALEFGVRHPLSETGLTKEEVRLLSRQYGLSTAEKPAAACLASRIPYGTPLTKKHLAAVAKGERFLREVGITGPLRLRHHGQIARVEVAPEEWSKILSQKEEVVTFLKRLGFRYVTLDIEGYRTGSLNPLIRIRIQN